MKFFVYFVVFFIPLFASAAVVINEIAWMGTGTSATDEWIELYNDGSEAVNFDGWTLAAEGGQPHIALSGSIAPGGYFLLERSDDETVPGIAADLIYTGALSNSGETLALRDASGAIVDSIDAADGWPAGDNTTKETMQKSASGWITAAGTPRAANTSAPPASSTSDVFPSSAPVDSSSTSDVAPAGGETPLPESKKSFIVDAGKDIKTVAGSEVRFQGFAYGFDGKLLDDTSGNARYLWNFGDGTFFEAQHANHIYRYPGAYRAALYVSSGQTSGSDVIEVRVGESGVAISEIAAAWIELVNKGAASVDVSSWQIYNSVGQPYTLPARTIIGPRAFVVFPQETTGLLFGPFNPKAELRYANGVIADTLSFLGTMPAGKSVIRREGGIGVLGDQTPGRENKVYYVAGSMYEGSISKEKISEQETTVSVAKTAKEEKNKNKNPIIRDTNYMLQAKIENSIFASNYFWLAASISIGLLAGAVVLGWRFMIL